jgi:hypothetical protein
MNKQEAQALLRDRIVLEDVEDNRIECRDLYSYLGFSKGEYGELYVKVGCVQGENNIVFRFPGGYLVAYQWYGSCDGCSGTLCSQFNARIKETYQANRRDPVDVEKLIPLWIELMNDQINEMEWFDKPEDVLEFIKASIARERWHQDAEDKKYKEEDMVKLQEWLFPTYPYTL